MVATCGAGGSRCDGKGNPGRTIASYPDDIGYQLDTLWLIEASPEDARMTAKELLDSLRAGGAPADAARAVLAAVPDNSSTADSATRRAEVTRLLAASLRPGDREIARWLLSQETAALGADGHGATETLYTLIAAVARYADPDDVLLLWRAREATPETRAGVDVEQLARAGVDRVRRRLQALVRAGGARAGEAAEALQWLDDGFASGAGSDLPGYFAWSDERFGLRVAGPT